MYRVGEGRIVAGGEVSLLFCASLKKISRRRIINEAREKNIMINNLLDIDLFYSNPACIKPGFCN